MIKNISLRKNLIKLLNSLTIDIYSSDNPQVIEKEDLEPSGSLNLSAAAMITLCTLLPYLIADKIPREDNHWKNFVCLLKIPLLSLSPIVNDDTICSLKYLIAMHNEGFSNLYPEFPPKMHYLVHLPEQMKRFGPLKNLWCMRFESKNGFFKLPWRCNFKNITKSLSTYHQQWMCSQMLGPDGKKSTSYLYGGDEVAAGYNVCLSALQCGKEVFDVSVVL